MALNQNSMPAGDKPGVTLQASRDPDTGLALFPRLPEGSPAGFLFEPATITGPGELYSFTVIHPNPKTGETPFVLAYVDFPSKVRVFGRLQMPSGRSPAIGMVVQAFSSDPDNASGSYHFIPAEQ